MKQPNFPYSSVHEYLDECNPKNLELSDQHITTLKKEYWRMYRTAKVREKRKAGKTISVIISPKEYAVVQKNAELASTSVTAYTKGQLFTSFASMSPLVKNKVFLHLTNAIITLENRSFPHSSDALEELLILEELLQTHLR